MSATSQPRRRIGLSKTKIKPLTASTPTMGPDDETQQPLVASSSHPSEIVPATSSYATASSSVPSSTPSNAAPLPSKWLLSSDTEESPLVHPTESEESAGIQWSPPIEAGTAQLMPQVSEEGGVIEPAGAPFATAIRPEEGQPENGIVASDASNHASLPASSFPADPAAPPSLAQASPPITTAAPALPSDTVDTSDDPEAAPMRRSPSWQTRPSTPPPLTTPPATSRGPTDVDEDEDESLQLEDSLPSQVEEGDSIATPPDSHDSEPKTTPIVPPTVPTKTTTPMRTLSNLAQSLSMGAALSQTYRSPGKHSLISPMKHANDFSPRKRTTPSRPLGAAATTPASVGRRSKSYTKAASPQRQGSPFGLDIMPEQKPSEKLEAAFAHGLRGSPHAQPLQSEQSFSSASSLAEQPPQEVDQDWNENVTPKGGPSSSVARPQFEATFLNETADAGPLASPTPRRLHNYSQTFVDAPGSPTQVDSTPPPRPSLERRFGKLPLSTANSMADLGEPFSDPLHDLHDIEDNDVDESPGTQLEFQATQVVPAQTESLPKSPSPSPTGQSVHAWPDPPAYRTLQRHSSSSGHIGADSGIAPPAGLLEETYVDENEGEAGPPMIPSPAFLDEAIIDDGAPAISTFESERERNSDFPAPSSTQQNSPQFPTPTPAVGTEPLNTPSPEPERPGSHDAGYESMDDVQPVRHSPNKYGRRHKLARSVRSVSDIDSSSSDPDDPNDQTFVANDTQSVPRQKRSGPVRSKGTTASPTDNGPRGKKPRTAAKPSSRIPSSRPATRNKRKAASPSPDPSSPGSGSTPIDEEDYTYRPTRKNKGKGKAKAAAPPPKPSEPPRKRAKSAKSAASNSRSPSRVSASMSTRQRSISAPAGAAGTSLPLSDDLSGPIRVLADWSQTHSYYAGTVTGRNTRGFQVKFDDNHTRSLPIDQLRRLELQEGDTVYDSNKPNIFLQVNTEWNDNDDKIQVTDPKGKRRTVATRNLAVPENNIAARFGDRLVSATLLERMFPSSLVRSSNTVGGSVLAGKIFVLTGNGSNPALPSDVLQKRIEAAGGKVLFTWEELFHIRGDSYDLAARQPPFVIQQGDRCVITPKVMSALATGIPVLAARYVEDAIRGEDPNWLSYLVSPGPSAYLGGLGASQVVDPNWGEEGWEAKEARAKRLPFQGMRFLYIEPSARHRGDLKVVVPFCLVALGASVKRSSTIPSSFDDHDLVLVDNRDKGRTLTRAALASGQLVNIPWLKSCLIVGLALPPKLMAEGET